MDQSLAARLNSKLATFEPELFKKIGKMARDYIDAGLQTLNYFVADMDAANDLTQCHAPLSGKKEKWENRLKDRCNPKNFIHPMASTEITTLTTFVSQILFGGATARKVEARRDEDEKGADMVNELLQWNDDRQPTYLQGYLWIWDALTFNRGVMYDHWQPISKVELEETDQSVPGSKRETYKRIRKKRKVIGGFNKIDLISPYDFVCDPSLPLLRFQEGRYAGHRVMIPWQELERRSKLPVDDYNYVLPAVVEKLKNRPAAGGTRLTSIGSNANDASRSRSAYERQRLGNPAGGPTDKVNKEDGGILECFAIHVRLVPKQYDIFPDEQQEIYEILLGSESDILSVNAMTNTHDEYPYGVGEARPNAHYQFSASWALIIKPIQDFVDYLKDKHAQAIARTSGNMFVANPAFVDILAITDPDKEGLIIPVTEEGAGRPLDQIIKQIPVIDTTAKFHSEMEMWIGHAETATGAHAFVQGQTESTGQTATQFAGVQQMATGRISSLARILSVSVMCPQTRRMVENFKQFLPNEMTIRITGNSTDFDADDPQKKYLTIIRDKDVYAEGEETADPIKFEWPDIQADFDIVPHDGSLPGTDARQVAALSRAMEVFSSSPDMATKLFDDTVPGSLNIRKIAYEAFKKSGLKLRNFVITKDQAQKNIIEKMRTQGVPVPPGMEQPDQGGQPPGPGPASIPMGGGIRMPGAGLPPQPTAQPALPSPASV